MKALLLLRLLIPSLSFLLLTWMAWRAGDNGKLRGKRRMLFLAGAITTVACLLLFVVFVFAPNGGVHYLFWLRGGLWTGLAATILNLFGRGRIRLFGVLSAGLIWALWVMFAWAPP
jgi:hypothetical protein